MFICLFPNLLSRPTHSQHRQDGIKIEHCKPGLHSPRGQASASTESMSRVLSPLSPQISPCSSTLSSNFLCKAPSLPSVLDANEAIFSDTVSESINDQELMSSVWKLSDLTGLLSFSLIFIFYFKGEEHNFCFVFLLILFITLYYYYVFLP